MKRERAIPFALFGVLISLLSASLLPCICGHLSLDALPGCVIGFLLVCIPFFFAQTIDTSGRIVVGVCLILTSIALFKCIADILWNGHNALL